MNVSDAIGLEVVSHSEIEFVDIDLNSDTKLFLDPCLIEFGKNKWAIDAKITINSYFDKFYELYKNNAPSNEKLELFRHAHEINATKLGYGSGRNGHAKTPKGMLETFSPVGNIIGDKIGLKYASDLAIFIRGFAEDCLSDMLTNILFKVLCEFTVDQCDKYGVPTSDSVKKYYYWDHIESRWKLYTGKCLVIEGEVILFVPKCFVRNRFYFNSAQYFTRVILERKQQEESSTDDQGKTSRPSKTSLRKKYQAKNSTLDTIMNFTKNSPDYLTEYHSRLPSLYIEKGLDDEYLDKILYC